MAQQKVFYFTAQTGITTPRRITSNFYQYAIPEIRRGEVMAEVEAAKVGAGGLEYPAQFLRDLMEWDRQGTRLEYK